MRILYFVLVATSLILSFSYSQEKVKKTFIPSRPFWSTSEEIGVIIPSGDLGNTYKASLHLGLDIAYNPKPILAIFFGLGYDILNLKQSSNGSTPAIIEINTGGRLYSGRNKLKFFAEASIGDYIYRYTLYNGVAGAPSSYSSGNLGIKGGVGGDLSFTNFTSVFIKADYTSILTSGTKSTFAGIHIGVRNIF